MRALAAMLILIYKSGHYFYFVGHLSYAHALSTSRAQLAFLSQIDEMYF